MWLVENSHRTGFVVKLRLFPLDLIREGPSERGFFRLGVQSLKESSPCKSKEQDSFSTYPSLSMACPQPARSSSVRATRVAGAAFLYTLHEWDGFIPLGAVLLFIQWSSRAIVVFPIWPRPRSQDVCESPFITYAVHYYTK